MARRQQHLRRMALAGAAGTLALLGGCVVAPPGYGAYGEAAYVQPGPVIVAPPISLGIGIGGGRGYYGRPGYYGRGYYGGRGGYWR